MQQEIQVVGSGYKNLTSTITKVKLSKAISSELKSYLTKEEVDRLLQVIPHNNMRDYLLIDFMWKTGARVTEVISITRGDIDFYNKTIKIRWLKRRKEQQRVIPLHQTLAYSLATFTGHLNLQDRVFPLTRQRAFQILKQWGFKANLGKELHPHTLRHSFAVYFLKQRRNIVALQKLLGHSHITTTMVYLNIVQQDLVDEINQLTY